MLRVRDRGTGMDAETLARAFEPFFTTKPPGRGSGLGLAMVHGIVRDHGGATWIDSDVGQGTTVSCLLPVLEVEESEEVVVEAPLVRGQGERILLIDDEPSLVALGTRRLGSLGYEVVACSDPEEALIAIRDPARQLDLVITDFLMPKLSGLELAREIALLRPGLGIVLLTGHMEEIPEATLAEAGIRAVVKKPLTLPELARAVRDALEPTS